MRFFAGTISCSQYSCVVVRVWWNRPAQPGCTTVAALPLAASKVESAAPRVHLEARVALERAGRHQRAAIMHRQPLLRAAVAAIGPGRGDERGQLARRC